MSAEGRATAHRKTAWDPEGVDLAVAFVRARTGVGTEVPLSAPRRRARRGEESPAWSGPGPGPRDPVPAGDVVDSLVAAGGWDEALSAHAVTARWEHIVGETVAQHTTVVTLGDGVLQVRCDSSAWATQLRLLAPTLLARVAAEVGAGVVTSVQVQGPSAPSWVRGPRRVKGRGPRDTYG